MKSCSKKGCSQINPQPLSNFNKNKGTKDSLDYTCRSCRKDYYSSNKETIRKKYKGCADSEEQKEKRKKYRERKRDKIKEYSKEYSTRDVGRFRDGKQSARSRGHSWELTFDQYKSLIVDKKCHYCNGPLCKSGVGLDRKDNSIGYTYINVIPCCGTCNKIKGKYLIYDEMVLVMNRRMAK